MVEGAEGPWKSGEVRIEGPKSAAYQVLGGSWGWKRVVANKSAEKYKKDNYKKSCHASMRYGEVMGEAEEERKRWKSQIVSSNSRDILDMFVDYCDLVTYNNFVTYSIEIYRI